MIHKQVEDFLPCLLYTSRVQDKIGDLEIVKLEVPTVFYKSIDTVTNAIEKEHPDVVLCIGQAGGRLDVYKRQMLMLLK